MSDRDFVQVIFGIALIGGFWAVFGGDTWGHIYLTLALLFVFLVCYAWVKVFPRRKPPSSE